MKIKIKTLTPTATLPTRMSSMAAGYDLFADIENDVIIKPLQRILIPTGIAIAIPENYEAQIRPRSGMAINYGITVINSPGTIDSDYRGEIKIGLVNLSNEEFAISKGSRIAQMIISKHETIDFELTEELTETLRGTGGFGST